MTAFGAAAQCWASGKTDLGADMVAGMLMGLMLAVAGEHPRVWPLFAMDTARGSPELLAELGYSGQSGTLNGDARAGGQARLPPIMRVVTFPFE